MGLPYFSDLRLKNFHEYKTSRRKNLGIFYSNQSDMILRQEDLSSLNDYSVLPILKNYFPKSRSSVELLHLQRTMITLSDAVQKTTTKIINTWFTSEVSSGFIRSNKSSPLSDDKPTLAKGSKAKMRNH